MPYLTLLVHGHAEGAPGPHYINSQFLIDDMLTYYTCGIFIFSVSIDMYTSFLPYLTPLVHVRLMEVVCRIVLPWLA